MFRQLICQHEHMLIEDPPIFAICSECGYRKYLYYKEITDPITGIELCYIQGTGNISSFWIGKYKISCLQYLRFTNTSEDICTSNSEITHAKRGVSRSDCQSYISKLNTLRHSAFVYRLPYEDQWVYSCYEDTDVDKERKYAAFGELRLYAMLTHMNYPSGQLLPNDFGLYDMLDLHGEYCYDLAQWLASKLIRATIRGKLRDYDQETGYIFEQSRKTKINTLNDAAFRVVAIPKIADTL